MNLKSIVFLVISTVTVVFLVGCESVFDEDLDEEDIEARASIVGTYEAENFTFQGSCTKGTSHAGYSGTGYMDYGGNNSLVEWGNIKVPAAGQYTLAFRFANASSGNRQCLVTLNDTTNLGNVSFQPTGAWTTWKTVAIKANLRAGSNKIRVTANTSNGGPNLDKMEVISEGSTSGPCAVANENSTATLSCPSGQVVGSVTFASYGTPAGSCPSFSNSSCHASSSKSKVEAACLNKPSCTVGANNSVFGDPCPGTYKKLAVAYTCRNITTANPCAQVSENSTANPSCPSGQVIRSIDFASYGTPTGSCPNFSTSSCHASNSTSKVEAACLNKPSCTVGANNSVFGDPCPGTAKKLAVAFTCTSTTSDGCPSDPNKTAPGVCGCGVADTDADRDGTPDCKDGCQNDATKTSPGLCGCGVPEGSCSGGAKVFANHVGGYQSAVTSGGFVPSQYNAGFSMYVAAWPLFQKYPGNISQSGLFGTWMHTQPVQNPPIADMYSDIEGGLGWWRNTRFGTETPKFIMGGVALHFSGIANGPGAGAGTWDNPMGLYGVAQLSPWVLFPPDGLNLKQGTAGELFGYGYLPLPLTDPKKVTDGKSVVTGNQCWTVFLNTGNFKGPLAFFLPYFFSKPSVADPRLSGMFLDSRPATAGGPISMETQHTPAAQSTTPDGRTYARMAPLLFPSEADGTSVFVHNLYYYDKSALWDKVATWFAGGAAANGYIDPSAHFHREFSRYDAGLSIWENPYSGGAHKELVWDNVCIANSKDPNSNTTGWNRDLVKQVQVGGHLFNLLPEYYALNKATNTWNPVRPETVPASSGLQSYQFPVPSGTPSPYVTPTGSTTVWKSPGPVAGPFYAYPGDGSKVTYYWYRFADQPAMLMGGMTAAERETVQKRVEKIHRSWTKDRNYLAPPAIAKALAQIDPALVVVPPPGLEAGYVPIVTRQERAN